MKREIPLSDWLLSADISGIALVLQYANVKGSKGVESASPQRKGPFWIMRTMFMLGPAEISNAVIECDGLRVRLFANFADVLVSLPYKLPLVHVKAIEAWVDEEDRKNRVSALNEIGCPTYKIVEYAAGEDRLVEADE